MRIGGLFAPRIIARAAGLTPATLRHWSLGFGALPAPLAFLGETGANGRRMYGYADAVLVTVAARLAGADGAGLGFATTGSAILIANKLAPFVSALGERFGADALAQMGAVGPVAIVHASAWPAHFEVETFNTRALYAALIAEGVAPRANVAPVVAGLNARLAGGGIAMHLDMTALWQAAVVAVTRAADASLIEDSPE